MGGEVEISTTIVPVLGWRCHVARFDSLGVHNLSLSVCAGAGEFYSLGFGATAAESSVVEFFVCEIHLAVLLAFLSR